MSTISPNMGLVISTVGIDSGLLWEQNLNASELTIDGHNHTPGNGVQIPTSGLNINGPLSFNGNSAINLQSIIFTDQASNSVLNSLYTINGELWYNDPTKAVQITLAGNVNATSSGITSGTASASFVSSVLVVNAAPSTPANIQVASILLGNNVSGSKFLTLSPPSAMAANYPLVLPSLPGVTSFLTLDTSGNITGGTPFPLTSAGLATAAVATANIANGAVTTTQIASQTIAQGNLALRPTGTSVAAGGLAISSPVASYSNATSTPTAVASITIITTGRPVMILLTSVPGASSGSISSNGVGSTEKFQINNGSTTTDFNLTTGSIPPSAITYIDTPVAGTYTYTLLGVGNTVSSASVFATNVQLMAYEI